MTEDGFQMGRHVVPKDGHSRVKYSDATRKTSTRVFTNANCQQNITLRTASQASHDRKKHNNGYNRNKQCEIFLSNLHSDTSEQEIMRYMRAHYHGYFKVESIRTQYSDYASFKVVAPMNLKNKLLNKSNWVENICVRPFYSKPLGVFLEYLGRPILRALHIKKIREILEERHLSLTRAALHNTAKSRPFYLHIMNKCQYYHMNKHSNLLH